MKTSEFTYRGIVVKLVPDSKPHKWEVFLGENTIIEKSVKDIKNNIDGFLPPPQKIEE